MANLAAERTGKVVMAFLDGATCYEAAQASGVDYNTVRRYVRSWHQLGVVYIDRWQKALDGTTTAVYQIGKEEDTPRPAAMTRSQRQRRYMDRLIMKAVNRRLGV